MKDLTVEVVEAVVAELIADLVPAGWQVVRHAEPEELEPDTVAVTVSESTPLQGYEAPPANVRRHVFAVTVYGDRTAENECLGVSIQRRLLGASMADWFEAARKVAERDWGGVALELYWPEPEENRTESAYDGSALAVTVTHAIVTGTITEEDAQ